MRRKRRRHREKVAKFIEDLTGDSASQGTNLYFKILIKPNNFLDENPDADEREHLKCY